MLVCPTKHVIIYMVANVLHLRLLHTDLFFFSDFPRSLNLITGKEGGGWEGGYLSDFCLLQYLCINTLGEEEDLLLRSEVLTDHQS